LSDDFSNWLIGRSRANSIVRAVRHCIEFANPEETIQMTSTTQRPPLPIQRLGDTAMCPVCGHSVHPDAYHCTQCRSFFCFHCRARQADGESGLQCNNKECGYYGKLVCENCDPPHEKQEKPTEYMEPIDGYWPGWLVASLVLSVLVWIYSTWLAALITLIGVYAGLGYVLQAMGFNLFGRTRLVALQRVTQYHSCICCEQTVKKVPVGKKR